MPTNKPEYYKKNKEKYFTWPEAVEKSKLRMRARRLMEKHWRVKKWDGKEVDHINWLKGGNGEKNLRVVSSKTNRKDWALKAIKKRLASKKQGWKY